MQPNDLLSVSLVGTGALLTPPESAEESVNAIKEYYNQLKGPYLSSQRYITQRLQAVGERLRECRNEMLRCDRDKERLVCLKEKADSHQSELDEMEAGLNWAGSKIRDLELQMEEKIHDAASKRSMASAWAGPSNLFQTPIYKAQDS